MALFQGNTRVEGSRSNTALIKSGHMSPAEDWILDQRFKSIGVPFNDGVLFNYSYGGTGQEDVVIPKGRVVGVGPAVKDFVSKQLKTTITLPGLATNANTIGMAPYNFTKDWFQLDRFGGNKPSIITLDYVTLPYIPTVTADARYTTAGLLAEEAAISTDLKMPWGAVIGAGIVEGDYLKATPSGRLAKWDKAADGPMDVVGQVLATDFNQEQWGWLKWLLWNEAEAKQDDTFINRSGASNLPSDNGYPFDPKYPEGNTIFQSFQNQYLTNPTGIPGLHDGSGNYASYGRQDTEFTDVVIGPTPEVTVADTIMAFQLKDYAGGNIKNIKEIINVKVDGVALAVDKLTVDYKNGIVTAKLPVGVADLNVTCSYKVYFYGTPSYLDFKGVVGSLFVLLKK